MKKKQYSMDELSRLLKIGQASEIKKLRDENLKLKRLVADLSLGRGKIRR